MTDTLPKMHVCKNCGFMSTRGHLFEMVGDTLLCKPCVELPIKLFYFEAGAAGLIPGRGLLQARESLSSKIGLENITVFREATAEDIARVEAESGARSITAALAVLQR